MDYDSLPIEISMTGIYFPPLIFACILGASAAWGIYFLMCRYEVIDFVWRPPVFYLALTVICTCVVGIFMVPI